MPAPKKILLIDDEPDLVKIIAFRLKKAGYEVLTAGDGMEGLHLARSLSPDVILVDLNLPGLTGGDVCRELKKDEKHKRIPVIVLSATSDGLVRLAREAGAEDCLAKPFEIGEILSKIDRFL